MRLPQRVRSRCPRTGKQPVIKGGQGMMLQSRCAFDARQRLSASRQSQGQERAGEPESGKKEDQARGNRHPAGQQRPQADPGQAHVEPGHDQGALNHGPDAFPKEGRARKKDGATDAAVRRRRARLCRAGAVRLVHLVCLRGPIRRPDVSPLQGSPHPAPIMPDAFRDPVKVGWGVSGRLARLRARPARESGLPAQPSSSQSGIRSASIMSS